MLRIGYYLSSNAIGGLERHVLLLIERLRTTHHVEVFCDDTDGAQLFCKELDGIGVIPRRLRAQSGSTRGVVWPSVSGLPRVRDARNAFAEVKLDVIHFHAGQLGLMYAPAIASCMAGISTRILTLHNPILRHPPLRRFIETRLLERLSRIVTVSDYMKRELISKKGVASERIRVIPNGVDLDNYGNMATRESALSELGASKENLVVGFVGRLHHLKGVDLLIDAAAAVKKRLPRVEFVFVGDGPEDETLKELAAEHGVSDIVRFAGYRRDAWRLMPAFDVVVLPSRDEAQSISLLEAMACGKPVVAARVGGIPEVVDDRVTGLLFPRENVSMLAKTLIDLLDDPQRRAIMGAAGRQRVRERFSQEEMLQKTLALYNAGAADTGLESLADSSA